MRQIVNLNHKWAFTKIAEGVPETLPMNWDWVNLPHSWNAIDGQDGGGDFYRGTCYYAKSIDKMDLPQTGRYYLEIRGANSSADVYVNGRHLAHHDGGYSTWRVDVTDALERDNLFVIAVDNAENDRVYPQMADFTFYGGLYRDVNLICVDESHFDVEFWGSNGLKITPEVDGADAHVKLEAFVKNVKEGQTIRFTILNGEGETVAETESPAAAGPEGNAVTLDIPNVHLWHGRRNPYLYEAEVVLLEEGREIDWVEEAFGCRTYEIDPERGFILNGEEYPLRGVSRHQDRWGIGNALLPEHHEEDMELIAEVGATTIRLAHYQHDQYFYDLCDEYGMVVWAEIPYISKHMPGGRENTITQMKELVAQNYNHPSIVVWGLSNEIGIGGSDSDLLENHHILNDMVHKMDPTRLTTIAAVSMCSMDDSYLQIPDVVSYNHYFGWYGGETDMNGPWFDKFHEKHPDIPIGCSEYGCEALNWHTSSPVQGDYTEEYQAYYHEELIKQLFTRKYLWATHVWNMFDFGADNRAEGGENGQNHKGLVTFDRSYKKDSFYAYKAWLSDEPFVHLCGKRYVDRVEDVTRVTVYSNLPEVELFANGQSLGKIQAADHFFYFDVPNAGETVLTAVAVTAEGEEFKDESIIRKVEEFNEDYRLKEKGAILNWFDIDTPEGRFSLNDKLSDIMGTFRGKLFVMNMARGMMKQMKKGSSDGKPKAMGFEINGDMMKMVGGFTLLRLSGMLGMANIHMTKEELLAMNAKLNKIKKPKK